MKTTAYMGGLLLIGLLVGCATATDTYLAGGVPGKRIVCNGDWLSYSDCMRKAKDVCAPASYVIIRKEGDQPPTYESDAYPADKAKDDNFSFNSLMPQRSMLIRCN